MLSSAALDRLLAVLVLALAATGTASLWAGRPPDGWLFVAHGILAGMLAFAVALKVRRSVPRAMRRGRITRLVLGLTVTFAAVAALTAGYLWVVAGVPLWVDVPAVGRWTILTVHAWMGLVLVPLVVVHLLPTRWRLLRPGRRAITGSGSALASRRALVAAGMLGIAGVGTWIAADAADRARGRARRFTGSRWLPAGTAPIPTTFLGEPVPRVEAASWALAVEVGDAAPVTFDQPAVRALPRAELGAVLDCTSGWAVENTWAGVALTELLAAAGVAEIPGTARVEVRSITGWSTSLAPADARRALLAWTLDGSPLPAANGAPLRLVVPDRRGLEWVKWISTIRVTT